MKSKIIRSLFILLFSITAQAQTQVSVVKKMNWNVVSAYDSKYGTSVNLPNRSTAMIVNVPKADFAIVNLDDKLNQKWLSPLTGFPMAIGKFKNYVLVIAAADRSYVKSFSNSFKAYLLDEENGKLISEKVIYEGSTEYLEQPDFFFAKDGSYFKMSSRLTGMKRKMHVILPLFGFVTALRMDKQYRETQNFTIINFDEQLNQKDKVNPKMPPGDSWKAFCNEDGSFLITTINKAAGELNIANYLSSDETPLKVVKAKIDFHNKEDYGVIYNVAGKDIMTNYIAMVYKNMEKEQALLVAKADFKDGSCKIVQEVLDKTHMKDLRKSFVPANKKFDDLEFDNASFMDVRHIDEYGDKLLVSLSSRKTVASTNSIMTFESSVLMNVYDLNLKPLYHQFIPRDYRSMMGEGSEVSYSLSNNTLRMIANTKDGATSVNVLYSEMDMKTGQMLKMTLIPKNDIKSSYYVNTTGVSWLDKSFIVPHFDHAGLFSNKIDVQLQLLNY